MLDVLVPIPFSNIDLVDDFLRDFEADTSIPINFIGIVDGGAREDLVQVEESFHKTPSPWKLLHNRQPVYLNQSIREAFEESKQQIVVLATPQVRLMDPEWFGKVQRILDRDPSAVVVDMWPNTDSATLTPVKRQTDTRCPPGCRFAVLRRGFLQRVMPYGDVDPVSHWSAQAISGGWASWAAPGVLYAESEHEEHKPWCAPLAGQSGSE